MIIGGAYQGKSCSMQKAISSWMWTEIRIEITEEELKAAVSPGFQWNKGEKVQCRRRSHRLVKSWYQQIRCDPCQ